MEKESKSEYFPKNSIEAKDLIERALNSKCMCCGLRKSKTQMECLPCWHGICFHCFRNIAQKDNP